MGWEAARELPFKVTPLQSMELDEWDPLEPRERAESESVVDTMLSAEGDRSSFGTGELRPMGRHTGDEL